MPSSRNWPAARLLKFGPEITFAVAFPPLFVDAFASCLTTALPSRSSSPWLLRSVDNTPVTWSSTAVAVAEPVLFLASTSNSDSTLPSTLSVPVETVLSILTPSFSPPKVNVLSGRSAFAVAVALPSPCVEASATALLLTLPLSSTPLPWITVSTTAGVSLVSLGDSSDG